MCVKLFINTNCPLFTAFENDLCVHKFNDIRDLETFMA
jgi:hypothetical protein